MRGMLKSGVVLLHKNFRTHTAALIPKISNYFSWYILEHSLCSLDLAPSDYHVFPNVKKKLGSKRFKDDDELKAAVNDWLRAQSAEFFFKDGIGKLLPRYDKCLNLNGYYVEK